MATATILLGVGAAVLSDGSASNAAPQIKRTQGTDANPKKHFLVLAFDASTQEHCSWQFRMPTDYSSGGTLKISWMGAGASGNNVIWGAQVSATTPADADTPIEHAKSSAATVTTAGNATEARRLNESSISLNMDSAAAGDFIVITLYRDADDASDNYTSDAEVVAAAFEYTTT